MRGGALIKYVGVSLSKSPTQASKVMKMTLLTYQWGMDAMKFATDVCDDGGIRQI